MIHLRDCEMQAMKLFQACESIKHTKRNSALSSSELAMLALAIYVSQSGDYRN